MKMDELEVVKTVVHNYLIATLTYSTIAYDLGKIKSVVKVAAPYEMLLNQKLNTLNDEIKELRNEMNALKIGNIPSNSADQYFVEYTIVVKGEEHKVQYARAALKNHVTNEIKRLFDIQK